MPPHSRPEERGLGDRGRLHPVRPEAGEQATPHHVHVLADDEDRVVGRHRLLESGVDGAAEVDLGHLAAPILARASPGDVDLAAGPGLEFGRLLLADP